MIHMSSSGQNRRAVLFKRRKLSGSYSVKTLDHSFPAANRILNTVKVPHPFRDAWTLALIDKLELFVTPFFQSTALTVSCDGNDKKEVLLHLSALVWETLRHLRTAFLSTVFEDDLSPN